jgi:hypothetical protein
METPAEWHVAHLFVLALHAGAAVWDLFFSSKTSLVSVLIDAGFLDSHMSASDYRFASAPSVSLRGTFFRKHTRENMSKNAEKYNRVCTHTETADQMHEDSRLKSNHIRRTFSK